MDKPTIKFVSVNRNAVKPYKNNPRENEGAVAVERGWEVARRGW